MRVEQSGGGFVEAMYAAGPEAKAIGASELSVPGVPLRSVRVLHVQVHRDLADVMQQRGIRGRSGPPLPLGGLYFGRRPNGQQIRLAQLESEGNDLETVVQHAACIGVMMGLGGRKLLDER